MQRTTTTKTDVEDLLRVEHGLFNWLRETEMTFGIPPEEVKSKYPLDFIPFLRSGKTLCACLKLLFPDFKEQPSTRSLLKMCRYGLRMDPDDLFTEADVAEVTDLYGMVVSFMKMVDAIIDYGEDHGVKFPRKFNPPTEDRRNFVSVEDELKYLRYVNIDVLDPMLQDEELSRVKGFDRSSSRTQSLMTNSLRSPMFGGGLEENFVDHLSDNCSKGEAADVLKAGCNLMTLQKIEEFESSPFARETGNGFDKCIKEEDELHQQVEKLDEEGKGNEVATIEAMATATTDTTTTNVTSTAAPQGLKLEIDLNSVPAVEKVKSAKAVKLFKKTLSETDFANLEVRCREEIEKIKTQLEQLYERSKTEYFDIWKQLLILSGKKRGLNNAQRFPEPMKGIKKAFNIELQRNRELKLKCLELKAEHDASESKKAEVEALIRRVEEQSKLKDDGKSPSQVRLEKLKRKNKDLKAERLNLDINLTNQYNDISRSVRTKNTSLLNSSRSFNNTSMSMTATGTGKPKSPQANILSDISKPKTAVEHTQKKLEVMRMYLEEEQAKSFILNSSIEKLRHDYKTKSGQIKQRKEKTVALKNRMAELKESVQIIEGRKNKEDQKVKEAKSKSIRLRKDPRSMEAINRINTEMNRDILEELEHDEVVLNDLIAERKRKLSSLEEMIKVSGIGAQDNNHDESNIPVHIENDAVAHPAKTEGDMEIADDEVLDVNVEEHNE